MSLGTRWSNSLITAFFCLCLALRAVPVHAGVSVVGSLSRRMELAPGSQTQGRVIVRNPTATVQAVRAYLTGYQTKAGGNAIYGDPVKQPRSNAAWIHLLPQEQEIPAGGTASFNFIVRAPDDKSLAGTYWCMLMIEPISGETLEPSPKQEGKTGVNIRTTFRTGILLATDIKSTGKRSLRFVEKRLEVEEGRLLFKQDIENSGERYLNLLVWTELIDAEGVSIGRFDAGRCGVYPGSSVRLQTDLSAVPPGKYQALVVADNGDEHVFGARYELEIQAIEEKK